MIWRGWSGLCLISGAVVVPLFLEVFAGGSWIRFLALPLRYAWVWWLGVPVLRERWLPPRALAVALTAFCACVSGVAIADLLGYGPVHPGWFLGLEWWQRAVYPWLDLLPRWWWHDRPGYLWMVSVWNLLEGVALSVLFWSIAGGGRRVGAVPSAVRPGGVMSGATCTEVAGPGHRLGDHVMKRLVPLPLFALLSLSACGGDSTPSADLILLNGEVYTMEEDHPWASAVVVTGNTITAVLDDDDAADAYRGRDTRVVDLQGKFVLPGFIDGHVHFNNAGALINDANLLAVADDEGLANEMRRVTAILPEGEWISGGLWGAYEQWALGAEGAEGKKGSRWEPDRSVIDEITARHPCLLSSFDGELYLANTAALRAAGLEEAPVAGMELNDQGVPTGLIRRGSPALERLREVRTPKSHERMLAENRAALKALREAGIVEIHDIATPDQTARFVELQKNGELTVRVWLRPDLTRGAELVAEGLTMGLHPETKQPDPFLRYGALKGYIDGIMGTHGALFFEPYDDQPGNYGHYRPHTSSDPEMMVGDMEKMYGLIRTGLDGGFVPNVHAIGDKGVALMLDLYERLKNEGTDLTGFRVIHAQVVRPADFARFQELGVIAEVNPYHLSDDMRWMEERIGHERSKGAYAFKSLLDNGAMLSFGSDWPGTSAAEYHMHPRYLIHAAVNRTTLNHTPEGGWFPEQRISVAEALKAYTINNAFAAFEEDLRGSLEAGKLADITVCDRNLLEIDPADILNMTVEMTIVDGEVVFEREG